MGFGRVLSDFSDRAHSLMNALGGASSSSAIGGTPSFAFGQHNAARARVDSGAVEHMIGQRHAPDNPFTATLAQIEVNPKVNKTDNIQVKLHLPKPPAQMSKADYDKAYLKELFHRAGHSNITDGELAAFQSAVIKYTGAPFGLAADLTTLRDVHARTGRIESTTSEWRQAVVDAGAREIYRQRDEWTAAVDTAQAKSREYGTAAMKGWVALHTNAPVNLINGLTEPLRGVAAIGGAYIPAVPRWEAIEKSEYWQAGNKGQAAEVAGTLAAGALAGGTSVLATMPGKVIATLESTYNIGVGAAGVDPTQHNRAMSSLERTVRVVGGAVTAASVSRGLGGTTSAGTAMEAEAVTAEGVKVRVPHTDEPTVSTHAEMRGRGVGGGAAFEQRVKSRPELAPERFVKVIEGDKLTQAKGITNLQAADHIGFVKVKGGYVVEVSEYTTGNKDLTHLAKQLEGGFKIAQSDREYGHLLTNEPKFRIFTDNKQLVNALKAKGNVLKINGNDREIEVIFRGGARR